MRVVLSGFTSTDLGSVSFKVPTSLHGVDLMHSSTTIWPRTAASHLSMKLGERRRDGAAEPEGPLILAHLLLFLIQLIKALIRLTLTPSGNDEWAVGEAEQRKSAYCICGRG